MSNVRHRLQNFMPFAILIAASVALWPVACLFAVVHHLFTKQWRRVGALALLIPLWAISPLVILVGLGPYIPAPDAQEPSSGAHSALSLGIGAFCAVGAWWLLLRTFRRKQLNRQPHSPPHESPYEAEA